MQLALVTRTLREYTTSLTSGEIAAGIILVLSIAVVATFTVMYYMSKDEKRSKQNAEQLSLSDRARTAARQAEYTPQDNFMLNGKEWSAQGYGTVSGFVVRKGSIVRKEAFSSLTDKLHNLRQSFVDNGVLVDEADGDELVLRIDFEFDSSTAAASFVTGRKASGPYNWRDENGLTFGEYTDQTIPKA